MESVLAGKKDAKEALDNAVDARQRACSRKFERPPRSDAPSRRGATAAAERPGRRRALLQPDHGDGKARRLPVGVAALRAAGAAARDHDRLLLLAGGAGAWSSRCCSRTPSAADSSSSGCENFRELFGDEHYLASFQVTAVFSVLVAGLRAVDLAAARGVRRPRHPRRRRLQDAADLALRGRPGDRRRAVAVPVPSVARHRRVLAASAAGIDWNSAAERQPGDDAGRHRRGLEADQLQLPVLPRRPAVDPEVADRGRRDRRRRAGAGASGRSSSRCCRRRRSSCWSSTSSTRSSTPSAIIDAATSGGPGQATEILVYKVYKDGFKAARPRRLGGAVGDPDDHRHRADRRAVPLHRAQGAVLMDRSSAQPLRHGRERGPLARRFFLAC